MKWFTRSSLQEIQVCVWIINIENTGKDISNDEETGTFTQSYNQYTAIPKLIILLHTGANINLISLFSWNKWLNVLNLQAMVCNKRNRNSILRQYCISNLYITADILRNNEFRYTFHNLQVSNYPNAYRKNKTTAICILCVKMKNNTAYACLLEFLKHFILNMRDLECRYNICMQILWREFCIFAN